MDTDSDTSALVAFDAPQAGRVSSIANDLEVVPEYTRSQRIQLHVDQNASRF